MPCSWLGGLFSLLEREYAASYVAACVEGESVAMAAGAAEKLGADYGLAITGFAGPCGGTCENPVGTIFIALYSPFGVWSKRLRYPGPRQTVKRRAVNAGLDWLRRELVKAKDRPAAPARAIGLDDW